MDGFLCSNTNTIKALECRLEKYESRLVDFLLNGTQSPYFEVENFVGKIVVNDFQLQVHVRQLLQTNFAETLKCAIFSGNVLIVKYLQKQGLDFKNCFFYAIHYSCLFNNLNLLKYFIEEISPLVHQIDYFIEPEDCAPLCVSIQKGNIEIVEYLMSVAYEQIQNNQSNIFWRTDTNQMGADILAYSLLYGQVDVAKYLISLGFELQYDHGLFFGKYDFSTPISENFLPLLSKRQQYSYVSLEKMPTVKRNLQKSCFIKKSIRQHQIIKFLLKPKSLCIQTTYF
jgi:hypothetical protein